MQPNTLFIHLTEQKDGYKYIKKYLIILIYLFFLYSNSNSPIQIHQISLCTNLKYLFS